MPDDRLPNAHERQNRVRQCAYYLWEADGCPHGRDREYWQRAEAMISIEDSATRGQLPDTRSKPGTASGGKAKAAKTQAIPKVSSGSATDHPPPRTPKARGRVRKTKVTTIEPGSC
jgi:hypothetical protein